MCRPPCRHKDDINSLLEFSLGPPFGRARCGQEPSLDRSPAPACDSRPRQTRLSGCNPGRDDWGASAGSSLAEPTCASPGGYGGERSRCPRSFRTTSPGAITASGGSWNASIVAEVASWGDQRARGAWTRRLHRPGHRSRRFPSDRAGDRGDEPVRGRHQPDVLASALLVRRAQVPAGVRGHHHGRQRPCSKSTACARLSRSPTAASCWSSRASSWAWPKARSWACSAARARASRPCCA